MGYSYDDYKVKPLHIMLPKAIGYVKSYDRETKWMYFLLEEYNTIRDKEFDSQPVYNKNFFEYLKKIQLVMKLQIFTKNKFLRWILIVLVWQ